MDGLRTWGIVVAAGKGTRFGNNKLAAPLGGRTVLYWSTGVVAGSPAVEGVVLVVAPGRENEDAAPVVRLWPRVARVVLGGEQRTDSVWAGLQALRDVEPDLVVIHDGARPLASDALLQRVLAGAAATGACVPALTVRDTVKSVDGGGQVHATLPRESLRLIQTPQAFRWQVLWQAYEHARQHGLSYPDDASVVEAFGMPVAVVEGEEQNIKITFPGDLALAEFYLGNAGAGTDLQRVGAGWDIHRMVAGRPLVLGGVTLSYPLGLWGHSDADVLLHAIIDAMLGAAGLGDIGSWFPDTDPAYQSIASTVLLSRTADLLKANGWQVTAVDATVVLEAPRLRPYAQEITKNIAQILHLPPTAVNVKAKTAEGLGPVGRQEGIAAFAVVMLRKAPH